MPVSPVNSPDEDDCIRASSDIDTAGRERPPQRWPGAARPRDTGVVHAPLSIRHPGAVAGGRHTAPSALDDLDADNLLSLSVFGPQRWREVRAHWRCQCAWRFECWGTSSLPALVPRLGGVPSQPGKETAASSPATCGRLPKPPSRRGPRSAAPPEAQGAGSGSTLLAACCPTLTCLRQPRHCQSLLPKAPLASNGGVAEPPLYPTCLPSMYARSTFE